MTENNLSVYETAANMEFAFQPVITNNWAISVLIEMQVSWQKSLYFDFNLSEVCSKESKWHYINIGSGYGFVHSRCHAITWSNDNPFQEYKYAFPGLNELTTTYFNSIYKLSF